MNEDTVRIPKYDLSDLHPALESYYDELNDIVENINHD